MNKYQELIFRKSPRYILNLTIILIFTLLTFIFISCFYKYNKYYYFTGLQIKEGGNNYVYILVPYDEMAIIKNYDLIIDKKKRTFSYEVATNFQNDSNKLYKEVKLLIDDSNNADDVIEIIFQSKKTTILKEIKNKIKKGIKE